MVFPATEAASKGGAGEATVDVDAAARAGQAVTGPAQGDGAEPDATIRPAPPSRDYGAVVFDRLHCGRASLSSSAGHAHAPYDLLPPGSEQFIRWDPPPPQPQPQDGSPFALVVLLEWLGARQRHLRRYAELYRDRGVGSVRFVVPFRELLGLDLGRRAQRMVADLSAVIAAWCDADRRRTLLFHTFSNTGWLA